MFALNHVNKKRQERLASMERAPVRNEETKEVSDFDVTYKYNL
jgi:hypothetical protein